MEIKTRWAQDKSGNVMSFASAALYYEGTEDLASGLEDKNGNPLDNPFQSDINGKVEFAAPDGQYDIKFSSGPRESTASVQFLDVSGALPVVENIDTLRSITGNNGRDYMLVKFHTSDGDGGGGEFYWLDGESPGTYVDNGGTIIVPTGGDGGAAWVRELHGYVSLSMFGRDAAISDGDGVLTSSFSAALSAGADLCIDAPVAIAGSVSIDLDEPIAGMTIFGVGANSRIYRASGNTATTLWSIPAPAAVPISALLSSAVARGDVSAEFTDVSEFEVDDFIRMTDNPANQMEGSTRNGEYNIVASVDSGTNTVTFLYPFSAPHVAGSGGLSFDKINLHRDLNLRDFTLEVGGDGVSNLRGMSVSARDSKIRNVVLDGGEGAARGMNVFGDTIDIIDVDATNFNSLFSSPVTSYGVSVSGNNITVTRGNFENCRHGISKTDRQFWSKNLTYDSVKVRGKNGDPTDPSYDCLDFHERVDNGKIKNCTVIEGGIQTRSPHCTIDNNYVFRKSPGRAIWTWVEYASNGAYDPTITNNRVWAAAPTDDGFASGAAINIRAKMAGGKVARNTVLFSGGMGIACTSAVPTEDSVIADNVIVESVGRGISLRPVRTNISRNEINSGAIGLYLDAPSAGYLDDVTVDDNRVDTNGASGIHVENSGHTGLLFSRNRFGSGVTTKIATSSPLHAYPGLTMKGNVGVDDYVAGIVDIATDRKDPNASDTVVDIFSIRKATGAGSSSRTTLSGVLKVAFEGRTSGGNTLAGSYVVNFLIYALGAGNIELSLGTGEFIKHASSSGSLDAVSVNLSLSGATNTAATMQASITLSGSNSPDQLQLTASIDAVNAYTGVQSFLIRKL